MEMNPSGIQWRSSTYITVEVFTTPKLTLFPGPLFVGVGVSVSFLFWCLRDVCKILVFICNADTTFLT